MPTTHQSLLNYLANSTPLHSIHKHQTENFYLDRVTETQANYTGIYFVSCQSKLLFIGGSNKLGLRLQHHSRIQSFAKYADYFKSSLIATTFRVDDLEIAKQLKDICVNQFNHLTNYTGDIIQEQIELANDNYFDSETILFNSFYPDKFSVRSLIYAIRYSENPSQDLKLLAHTIFWEDKKFKPPFFGGGDVSGCRPMIDAELKKLYAIREMDGDRLTKVLTKNQQDRQQYINQVLRCIPNEVTDQPKSFLQLLNIYCSKEQGMVNYYKTLPIPFKVEMLCQVVNSVECEIMIVAAKQESRNYF